MPVELVRTEKNKVKLCEDGHIYYLDKRIHGLTHWRCHKYKTFRCRACVSTVNNDALKITRRIGSHNHTGDSTDVECSQISASIRTAAESGSEPPKRILANCLEQASQSALAALPKLRRMKRNIQNRRRTSDDYPTLPKHREDIMLPSRLEETAKRLMISWMQKLYRK